MRYLVLLLVFLASTLCMGYTSSSHDSIAKFKSDYAVPDTFKSIEPLAEFKSIEPLAEFKSSINMAGETDYTASSSTHADTYFKTGNHAPSDARSVNESHTGVNTPVRQYLEPSYHSMPIASWTYRASISVKAPAPILACGNHPAPTLQV